MNGVHDMGGMHNLGPLEVERDEPWFHHPWERTAFALTLATGALGEWNLDMARFARERIPAVEYLRSTYYEKWLLGMERLLVERGLVAPEEIAACVRRAAAAVADDAGGAGERAATTGAAAVAPVGDTGAHPKLLRRAEVDERLRRGSPTRVDVDIAPRFAARDPVVTRNEHPVGHTRLPRYARGRHGVIARDHGVFVFADAHAMGLGPQPQHLYNVRFAARELWGEAASAHDSVHLDLWEAHLVER